MDLIDLRNGHWATRYSGRVGADGTSDGPEMCRSGRHLRTAENHPVGSDGFRRCRLCEKQRTATPEAHQSILDWQRSQQDRTRMGAINKSRRWEDGEDRALLRMRQAGVTQAEIALALGRTFQSVRKRVGQLADR